MSKKQNGKMIERMKRKDYEKDLKNCKSTLPSSQEWVKTTGYRGIIVLEGRTRGKRRHHQSNHRKG